MNDWLDRMWKVQGCLFACLVCSRWPVLVAASRRANHPSKESYQLSMIKWELEQARDPNKNVEE
jgi:hypothetical protein